MLRRGRDDKEKIINEIVDSEHTFPLNKIEIRDFCNTEIVCGAV